MNNEFPIDPRQALETSLTALILGELPDDQARFLRQAIATDPELAKSYERLKRTIELVRETETSPQGEPALESSAPKLDERRRQQLLQRFKTVELEPDVAEEAARIRRLERVKLPDAIIWASARCTGRLLVTRNTKDFPAGDPGVRHPYVV